MKSKIRIYYEIYFSKLKLFNLILLSTPSHDQTFDLHHNKNIINDRYYLS